MPTGFLRTAQILVILNFIIQIIWFTHIIFPNDFVLYFEQVLFLEFTVGAVNLISSVFCFTYLFKKRLAIAAYALFLHALYYSFLLYNWYLLIDQNQSLEKYIMMQYVLYFFDLLLGILFIYSKSRNNKWIKRIGIIITISSVVNLFREFFFANEFNLSLQLVDYLLNLMWCMASIFWFLLFKNEVENNQTEDEEILDV